MDHERQELEGSQKRHGAACQVPKPTVSNSDSEGLESCGTNFVACDNGELLRKPKKTVITLHEDLIRESFWEKYPDVLV